jgi:hypothetical protein
MQQQTFYSAKAQPKPVPAHTAQAVNPGYLYYANCAGSTRGKAGGKNTRGAKSSRGANRSSKMNSNCNRAQNKRPTPRPSHRPAPRHS